jgi:5'-nucleotidase
MKSFHSPFLFGAVALCVLFSNIRQEPESVSTDTDLLRILIANDDGVDSAGLAELVKAFSSMGEVVVCAPPANRSGASQSSQLFSGPLELQKGEMEGAAEVWIVNGTPSDCVVYGLVHVGKDKPFDLVVAGINHGSNVGMVAHYSGTVGAATEGAMQGVLSLAVSQDVRRGSEGDFSLAAKFAVELAEKLRAENAPTNLVYSVNVPTSNPKLLKGVLAAPMGGIYLKVPSFRAEVAEGKTMIHAQPRFNMNNPPTSDTALFQQGNITVTPLRIDWSDPVMMKTIQGWDLKVSSNR